MLIRIFLPFFMLLIFLPVNASEEIVVGGSGADLETFRILAKAFKRYHPDCYIKVFPSIGSGGAVRGVASGRIDIGLMSRPINDKEKKHGLMVIHYADTALVYIVGKRQAISNVSIDDLKNIYEGDNPVVGLRPILRPKSDSDTLLLKNELPDLIPSLLIAYQRKGIPTGMTDQATSQMVESIDQVIATSTLSLIMTEKPVIKVLSLEGVSPTADNIASGRYPLRKQLYLVHGSEVTEQAQLFISFIMSDEGQQILNETGHFPVANQ